MELTQLQYFRIVANTGNMTRAAQQLHLSQPALSRTIARLEEDLGVKLFSRAGNRITLSHEGRIFLFRVEQFLAELEDGVKEIRDMSTVDRGHVSFSATTPELLEEFMLQYFSAFPEVQVFFRLATAEGAATELEERIIDFAVLEQQPASPRLQWRPLLSEPYLLLAAKDGPLAGRTKVDLTELEKARFIFTNASTPPGVYGDTVTQFCRLAGFDPVVSFKGMSTDIVYPFVAMRRGVMLVPASTWVCSQNPALIQAKGDIIALQITYPVCRREIGASTLRGSYLSKASQAVLDALTEFYKEVGRTLAEMGLE